MTVVSVRSLVLDVGRANGDTTFLLLRCLVDFGIVCEPGTTALGEDLRDSSGQRCLSVIDVSFRLVLVKPIVKFLRCSYRWYQC